MNSIQTVHFSLVIGKSRVEYIEIITIQKIERTAALLSVKMSMMRRREQSITMQRNTSGYVTKLCYT